MMCYSPSVYAGDGLDISYKVAFLPLEIVFDSDGISFKGTKTIVTPIGSFSLGYSKFASKFDEDYTYVIIEDMNQKKEHIYKIKDKKKLKLVSEGRTEITVTKNRVRIVVEKGSRFKVSFSVEGEEEPERSASSSSRWISPSTSTCKNNGGKVDSDGCQAEWSNAKDICRGSGGSLPTIDELKKVATDCGGTPIKLGNKSWSNIFHKNKNKVSYQSCYKNKGFNLGAYWSLSTSRNYKNRMYILGFNTSGINAHSTDSNRYVRCIRVGQ